MEWSFSINSTGLCDMIYYSGWWYWLFTKYAQLASMPLDGRREEECVSTILQSGWSSQMQWYFTYAKEFTFTCSRVAESHLLQFCLHLQKSFYFLPVPHCGSAVYAVAQCLCVRLSQASVLLKWLYGSSWFLAQSLLILQFCFKWILVYSTIRVLPRLKPCPKLWT